MLASVNADGMYLLLGITRCVGIVQRLCKVTSSVGMACVRVGLLTIAGA